MPRFEYGDERLWNGYEMEFFIDILNGDYSLEAAREDLQSLKDMKK